MTIVLKCSLFIVIYLGFRGMDCVTSELCYKGTILQRNYDQFYTKKNDNFMGVDCVTSKLCYEGTILQKGTMDNFTKE